MSDDIRDLIADIRQHVTNEHIGPGYWALHTPADDNLPLGLAERLWAAGWRWHLPSRPLTDAERAEFLDTSDAAAMEAAGYRRMGDGVIGGARFSGNWVKATKPGDSA